MSRITQLGTHVRLADGREGTVVYNSLVGVGIKWGLYRPDPEDFKGTTGNTTRETEPADWEWAPDALLRDPFEGSERFNMECVGEDYEIIGPETPDAD